MPDAARKQHGFSYWREAAIGVVGYIGELARAVAADAASGQGRELQIQCFWNNRDEDRAADPFASGRIVVVLKASAVWESHNADRIDDSVGKLTENAKGFHMDVSVGDSRVPGHLANDVGHLRKRYRIGGIEQRSAKDTCVGVGKSGNATAYPGDDGSAVEECRCAAAKCGRGIFRRYSGRYVIVEIFHEPDLRGALPDETWNVLCIDRQRNILLPRYDALGVHGRQGPGLTREEMSAEKVAVRGQVQMTHT